MNHQPQLRDHQECYQTHTPMIHTMERVLVESIYCKYFGGTFDELWDKGIDAIERIKDIEEGRETNDELADAKQYLNLVLEEVSGMQNKAAK